MIIKPIFIAAAALSVQAVAQLPAQQASAPAAT